MQILTWPQRLSGPVCAWGAAHRLGVPTVTPDISAPRHINIELTFMSSLSISGYVRLRIQFHPCPRHQVGYSASQTVASFRCAAVLPTALILRTVANALSTSGLSRFTVC